MPIRVATVRAADIPSSQTDFPIYVDLGRVGATALTLADAQSSRWYTDTDLVTQMAREIVSLTEGHGKYASLTSTSKIAIDYDGIRADYAVTDTYGRNAVWTGYLAVFHVNSDNTDSTGNGSPSTVGTVTYGSSFGKIGHGGDTPGSGTNYISTGASYSTGNTQKAFSIWFNSDDVAGLRWVLAGGTDAGDRAYGLFTYLSELYFHGNGPSADYIFTTALSNDTWYHAVCSYDGVNANRCYINGALNGTKTRALDTGSSTIRIGERQDTVRPWNGSFDEIKIVNGAQLSANWVTTEYNNQNAEATFWGTWADVGGGPAAQTARLGVVMMM